MHGSSRGECEMRVVIPATLQAIEDFFVEFHRRTHFLGDRNCFAVELLAREALTNAVVHGCCADPARQVRCGLRLRDQKLLIAVADDGDGFDWRAALAKEPEFPDCSGRGINILSAYADRLRYNARGNAMALIKRFR